MYNEVLSSECMSYVYNGNYLKPIVLFCLNVARALTQCHVLEFKRLILIAKESTSYENSQGRKNLN